MFYKFLNYVLIYILTILNFIIVLLPLWVMIVPLIYTYSNYIKNDSILTFVLMVFFVVSCITLLIMLFDFLFGISVRSVIKNTKEYNKIKNYEIFKDIFEDIKIYFNNKKVKLLISSSSQENAYAVGNMGKQYIIITKGLISLYILKFKEPTLFLTSLKCILGHEMSHLINKDYLPGLLLEINEKSIKIVSKIVYLFFNIFIRFFSSIPVVGRAFALLFVNLYNITNSLINFFYKYVIMSIYKLIQLKINRKKEYRCDKQSSMVNSGEAMATALSVFGPSGYMTIFSSHPKTQDRIKYIKDIKKNGNVVTPEFGNSIVNLLSILFMIFLPLIIYYFMNIKGLINDYNGIAYHIKVCISFIKIRFFNFLRLLKLYS